MEFFLGRGMESVDLLKSFIAVNKLDNADLAKVLSSYLLDGLSETPEVGADV